MKKERIRQKKERVRLATNTYILGMDGELYWKVEGKDKWHGPFKNIHAAGDHMDTKHIPFPRALNFVISKKEAK